MSDRKPYIESEMQEVIGTVIRLERVVTHSLDNGKKSKHRYTSQVVFSTEKDGYATISFNCGDVPPQNLGEQALLVTWFGEFGSRLFGFYRRIK